MAHRLATEYSQSRLALTEAEIRQVCQLFETNQIPLELRTCERGGCVLIATKDQETLQLTFRQEDDRLVCEGEFRIRQKDLVNVMRQIVSTFNGHAIVKRIYQQFTISYHYEHGTVVRIVEQNERSEQLIFERKHQNGEALPLTTATATSEYLQSMLTRTDVEQRIAQLRQEADRWLDIRNRVQHSMVPDQLMAVDRQLSEISLALRHCEAL